MRPIILLLLSAALLAVTPGPSVGAPRYDIVLILTDDQRWDTLQYMPNVTTLLAGRGVTFSNAFVTTPLCCPSRATILTGQYAHRHGVLDNDAPDGGATVFRDAQTIAVWLRNAGYRTALFGKYLNDYGALDAYVPPGWSEWAARSGGPGIYYDYRLVETGGTEVQYGTDAADYSTTVFTNKAVDFIASTPLGINLFLYLAPNAPHTPATPAPEDVGKFSSLAPWRPPSYNEADVSDKPQWVQDLPLITNGDGGGLRRKQIESLQAVDRALARIVEALSRAGRLSNTVIVFLSDNGLSWGEHRWLNRKRCPYEECIRIPFVVLDPGAVGTPRVDEHPVLNLDLAPAILRWAEVTPPVSFPYGNRNLYDLLRNPGMAWRGEFLIELIGTPDPDPTLPPPLYSGIRKGGAKGVVYIEYASGERELYDLQRDPYQLQNAYGDPIYASRIAEMQRLLAAHKQK